ncbi:MAG: recombination protein RecR [Phycisphaerae bacterium]|nr:recombination protein RecR [Phycisphaerae bacterium]
MVPNDHENGSPPHPAQASPTDSPPAARAPRPTPPPSPPRTTRSPYPVSVQSLIAALADLPGVGPRSAERLAFHILKTPPEEALALARAIEAVKAHVRHCSICFHLADADPCALCADPRRDRSKVLVVEQPKDLISLESTSMYRGVYHVLMGRLSPLDGIGPADLTIANLLSRLDRPERNSGGVPVGEVILGLNPTLEGDGTALYLAEQVRSRGVTVSRLARGIPTGSQLEYASRAVLADAIEGRQHI